MKSYKHLSKEERHTIYLLWNKQKWSITNIAKLLNKNKSTIPREFREIFLLLEIIIQIMNIEKYIRKK